VRCLIRFGQACGGDPGPHDATSWFRGRALGSGSSAPEGPWKAPGRVVAPGSDLCHRLPVVWSEMARRIALLAFLWVLPLSCDRVAAVLGAEEEAQNASRSYAVQIVAHDDARSPLAGVQVLIGTRPVGTTDASGSVRLSLTGNEGDVAALGVKCPDGFASPEKPMTVGLRHFSEGSPAPRFETQCVPLVRSFVVGVRTENGANLPIRRLNRVIGQTDDFGVAHLLLQAAPRDQVVLTLDTSAILALRPQNPTLTFVAPERDQMILLEQKFTLKKRVARVKPRVIPQKL